MSAKIIAGVMLIITVSIVVSNPDIANMAESLGSSNWIQKAFSAFKGA